MTRHPLTRQQALELMPDSYSRCELQLIWENSAKPINEIQALVKASKGEAKKLWNARLRGPNMELPAPDANLSN